MYKVVVVEDEEIARKGIIFTINWDALNCMIAGEAANGEEGAEVIRRLSPDIIVRPENAPYGRRGNDRKAAGTGKQGEIYYPDGLWGF